jgi:catechol 2,3-dioxygenase-like lactoylglutathione lyase family enzyme
LFAVSILEKVMLDHLEIFVQDVSRSEAFYRAALAPLGYRVVVASESTGFGTDTEAPDFWIRTGNTSNSRPHFAFRCSDRRLVDAVHEAALAAGGVDNGKPAVLPRISENYYAGFVRDPDGHNVEFVCHAAHAQ